MPAGCKPRWQSGDEATLMRELRLFRRRMMVRIAWAQALSLVSEESTLQQLSELAETLIVAARDWLYAACCKEWGTPCSEGAAAAADPGDGQAGRRRAELLLRYRSDFCLAGERLHARRASRAG
jgi:hypothetical protein